MAEYSENILKTLDDIQALRGFLKTEMAIGAPTNGEVKAEIRIHNSAPKANGGSQVVFMGVGLVITDPRGQGIRKLNEKIKISGSPDRSEMQEDYNRGEWYSGKGNQRFPLATSDEEQHGQVLFPGESLSYEITVSEDDLQYLDILVESTISRRYLFRISRPMEVLRRYNQPRVAETFKALDKIDLFPALVPLADAIPPFSPDTTLADIDRFKVSAQEAFSHIQAVAPELNEVIKTAPNHELLDLLREQIRGFIKTAGGLCQTSLKVLESGDMGQIKEVAERLKNHLATIDEVKNAIAESKSRFGIESV